ncbi:MAG TPA: hypothetical protein VK918_04970 [Pyrinomonadaceae bacterium]|nr:hypothetical protein [Pyrinomonadaceae bacterium]
MTRKHLLHFICTALFLSLPLASTGFGQAGQTKAQPVRIVNTEQEAVPVKIIIDPAKRRFQLTVFADIGPGGDGRTVLYPVPVGKRLVIENVSAHTYRPPGLKMNIVFKTYFDNGDLFGDDQGLSFHGIALIEQGTELSGYEVGAASHDVLAFAEDRLGTIENLPIRVNFSMSGTVPFGHFARGTVVFTGYVEDIATPQ